MLEKQSKTTKTEFSNNAQEALHGEMKDQMHKYKMRNHERAGRVGKKKDVRTRILLKANTSKAVKSPERQISYEMHYYRSIKHNRELFSSSMHW